MEEPARPNRRKEDGGRSNEMEERRRGDGEVRRRGEGEPRRVEEGEQRGRGGGRGGEEVDSGFGSGWRDDERSRNVIHLRSNFVTL